MAYAPSRTFLFQRLRLCRRGVILKHCNLACKYFVVGSLRAVSVGVFRCPQSSDDMQRHAYADSVYIRGVLTLPRYYVVPCRFGNGSSVPCLVQQVGGKRKIGYYHPVMLVGAYYSHASLELDPVDVFHKIFVLKIVVDCSSPHLMRAW